MKSNATQKERQSRLYRMWMGLFDKCNYHKHYLDLEIQVCNAWRNWENFRDWALANGYKDYLEIDRKKSTDNYSPETCRFVTDREQTLNRVGWGTSSKYKGVRKVKTKTKPLRWRAVCHFFGKTEYLGFFDTEIEAAEAYDDRVFQMDPEFAYLNFPERKLPSVPQ